MLIPPKRRHGFMLSSAKSLHLISVYISDFTAVQTKQRWNAEERWKLPSNSWKPKTTVCWNCQLVVKSSLKIMFWLCPRLLRLGGHGARNDPANHLIVVRCRQPSGGVDSRAQMIAGAWYEAKITSVVTANSWQLRSRLKHTWSLRRQCLIFVAVNIWQPPALEHDS